MYTSTGDPIRAVMAPTGSITRDSIVFATMSASSSIIPPIMADVGMSQRRPFPTILLLICGAKMHMNPMGPTKATTTAVTKQVSFTDISSA